MGTLLYNLASAIYTSGLPQPNGVENGSFVKMILEVAIGIIAVISVLMIAISGLRYILSQGDPQAAAKAKGGIIGALIGLVVAILAQGIVIFIVKAVS